MPTLLALVVSVGSAQARGLNRGLCEVDTSRGGVPANFVIDGCVAQGAVTVRNSLSVPVQLTASGSVGPIRQVTTNTSFAANVTRLLNKKTQHLLMPGDIGRVSVGGGEATVRMLPGGHAMSQYVLADAAAAFMPTKSAGRLNDTADFINEVADALDHFSNCRTRHPRGPLLAACQIIYGRDIAFAYGRAAVRAFVSRGKAMILAGRGFAKSVDDRVKEAGVMVHSSGLIRLAAVSAAPPAGGVDTSAGGGPPAPPPGETPPPPSAGPGPSITATRGGAYGCSNCSTLDVGVHNFPTGTFTYVCHDNSGPGGSDSAFYSHAVAITDLNQSVWPGVFCWDNAPYTAYVVINGVRSNDVSFGSAPPPPPPPAAWNETPGGVTHTWTNYTNAGGNQGPSIQTGQTVQVACKVQGFAVADGDTWWYRIASSPWNSAYYASADAFYNNGQTSGSLHGTPFVDNSVANC